MAKQAAQGKRTRARAPRNVESPEVTNEDQAPNIELDASLADFLLENSDGAGYTCKIYRRYPATNGVEQCSYLTAFQNNIPTHEALRRLLGHGEFRINVTYTNQKGERKYTSRNLELDPDPMDRQRQQLAAPIPAQQEGLKASDLVTLLGQLIKSMGEMAKGGNGKSPASELGEIANVFAQTMGVMANQQVGIMGEMQRRYLDLPDQEPTSKKPEGLVDLLVWAWNTFGKQLTENPAIGKMFAPQVKTMPQVQYMINNPDEYERVIDEFTEREGVDPKSIAQLLGSLDMPLPDEIRQATAGPQPTGGQSQAP